MLTAVSINVHNCGHTTQKLKRGARVVVVPTSAPQPSQKTIKVQSLYQPLPPGPPPMPPIFPPLYCERDTDEPPLTVATVVPMPSKMEVPPETVTPDFNVGVDEVETTNQLPPLDGVLKAKVVLPYVSAYHVFLFHEEAA